MPEKLERYLWTVRYLRPTQIFYQCLHHLPFRNNSNFKRLPNWLPSGFDDPLVFIRGIDAPSTVQDSSFRFLNRTKVFDGAIDWNFPDYGKLWVYNLNYFDFLAEPEMSARKGKELIERFIDEMDHLRDGMEPYPLSLRIVNWVKFLALHRIDDRRIDNALFAQSRYLSAHLEYRLLGNHLLENGFGLFFAGMYFKDRQIFEKSTGLLFAQFDEQLLGDGAHYERSPMYHCIILHRVLDCLNLCMNNRIFSAEIGLGLEAVARKMLCWLDRITFSPGDLPMVNDSIAGIAPSVPTLRRYARSLIGNFSRMTRAEGFGEESGYRLIDLGKSQVFIDAGNIGPDYQPGHGHSDSLNFLLYSRDRPFLVDSGTSTYERSMERSYERSTKAHNTVEIDRIDQSDVWANFRVGRRARTKILSEQTDRLIAVHDGYAHLGVHHLRKFFFRSNRLVVSDRLYAKSQHFARAFFHFAPGIEVKLKDNRLLAGEISMVFKGAEKVVLTDAAIAAGYGYRDEARMAIASFTRKLDTEIDL